MLAAGALVASILAVGATPAAGPAEQQPDARSTWLACVGAAKSGGGFTDVDMGSPHYDNINCLAYYGITTGKTADTYDPQSNVTRYADGAVPDPGPLTRPGSLWVTPWTWASPTLA